MKPRSISFSPPMVRANLAGRKTQTRRVARPRRRASILDVEDGGQVWADSYIMDPGNREWLLRDAPAQPGQLLYMTEAWGTPPEWNSVRPSLLDHSVQILRAADGDHLSRYRPAMHMPRWASRATLRVRDVRIERLTDIEEIDAVEEGVEEIGGLWGVAGIHTEPQETPVDAYRALWEHINGDGSWDENPLVWVISYEFIRRPIAEVLVETPA